ncbi:MAG: ribonuclease III [Bowdeniella nasicola]|nr:ribonuclease III [Bowdeniella nasicola]
MTLPALPAPAQELLAKLQVTIDPEILVLALTHRSFAHEAGGIPTNERLEFLGDSVLGYIVTDHLYRSYPRRSEADLSKIRSGVVSQEALSRVARSIGVGPCILLGKGEIKTGGAERNSILCDTMEALIGATYLTNGLEITRAMVLRLLIPYIQDVVHGDRGVDWRTALDQRLAELGLPSPQVEIIGEGPDHARRFTAVVTVTPDDAAPAITAQAVGTSKRAAQKEASRLLMAQLARA